MSDIDLVKYGVLWQKVESMEAKIDKMVEELLTMFGEFLKMIKNTYSKI